MWTGTLGNFQLQARVPALYRFPATSAHSIKKPELKYDYIYVQN